MMNNECRICLHRSINNLTCLAYPNGIPEEILIGEVSHSKPYKGDRGITYKPRPVFEIPRETGKEEAAE